MGIREELLEQVKQEIEPLERELKVELPRQLAEAAAHGDLSENAEYDAAKSRKELVQAQLQRLYAKKKSLAAINPQTIARDAVGFYSTVELYDVESGDEVTYRLVTSDESDPRDGKISLTSPIGRALVGKRVGDEVSVETPRGSRSYEVLDFTTIHDDTRDD